MSPVDNGSTWRHLPSQLIWNHDYTLSSSSSSIDHMSTTLVQSSATSWQRGKWILPSSSVETWHAVRVLFKRRFDTLQFCSARVRDDCILVFCDRPCATEVDTMLLMTAFLCDHHAMMINNTIPFPSSQVLALLLRHLPPPERSCGKWEYRDSGDRVVATFVHPPGA